MKISNLIIYISTILALFSLGCNDPVEQEVLFNFEKGEGYFVINEGAFGQGNATVGYYNIENDSMIHNVYEQANGQAIGDVLQSMSIHDNKAYLVVNNSALVRVVDVNSFEELATIKGFTSPREILITNEETALVSDLYAGKIWVVDLASNSIIDSIETGGWTEEMVMVGNKVFVTSPTLYGNPISKNLYVIDALNNYLIGSIELKANPTNIVYDDEKEKLYVFCQGDAYGEPKIVPSFYTIDPYDFSNRSFSNLPGLPDAFTSRMVLDQGENKLYILYGSVYWADVYEQGLAFTSFPLIESQGRSLYGLQNDPVNGNIFVTDAKDYNQLGTLYEYKTNGIQQRESLTGVVPSDVIFY